MSKHRTPLRYPGGKQRLAPFIIELLDENEGIGGHYVEPYAGGAGVALELLLGGYVEHIHLNDSALAIYSFWRAVTLHTENLCRRIQNASLTVQEWTRQREILRHPTEHDEIDLGFSTLYLNRCNRSGILSGGLIGGINQDGKWRMDARFSRNELIRRIEVIANRRDSISLENMDAEVFIRNYVSTLPDNTFVYCDPPYFRKSSKLYLNRYSPNDHARIAEVIQKEIPRKCIVSYDGADEILDFYQERRKFLYQLQYNASRVYQGTEVFIFSDDLNIPQSSVLPYIDAGLQVYEANMNM